MGKKSYITPGLAPSSQAKNYMLVRSVLAQYFGAENINAIEMLRKQKTTNSEVCYIFVLNTRGPNVVNKLVNEEDIQPLKELLEPLFGREITININEHRYFFFSGRISPPVTKKLVGKNQIEIVLQE
jgi:hypothetical protein